MLHHIPSRWAALACLATLPAVAQPLQDACPGLDGRLQEALVDTVIEQGEAARVAVTLSPRARGANEVRVQGGPLAYRHALRKALRGADCHGATDRTLAFTVAIVDPWGRGPAPR